MHKSTMLFAIIAQTAAYTLYASDNRLPNNEAVNGVEQLALIGDGPVVNYQNTKWAQQSLPALTNNNQSTTVSPLVYAHSNPVIVVPAVNIYPIFWGASWNNTSYKSDKITGLQYFYSHFGSSSYRNTIAEYETPSASIKANTVYTASSLASSNPNYVSSKICQLVSANNALDNFGYYPIYTDLKRGNASFCAYHAASTCNGKTLQFAFFFDISDDISCDPQSPYAPVLGSSNSQAPGQIAGGSSGFQQSQALAALANLSAHELAEAVTDPVLQNTSVGYLDSLSNEIGDKCAWSFGPSNTGLSAGTVTIGAYDWKLQGIWSNNAQIKGAGGYQTTSQYGKVYGCVTGS